MDITAKQYLFLGLAIWVLGILYFALGERWKRNNYSRAGVIFLWPLVYAVVVCLGAWWLLKQKFKRPRFNPLDWRIQETPGVGNYGFIAQEVDLNAPVEKISAPVPEDIWARYDPLRPKDVNTASWRAACVIAEDFSEGFFNHEMVVRMARQIQYADFNTLGEFHAN